MSSHPFVAASFDDQMIQNLLHQYVVQGATPSQFINPATKSNLDGKTFLTIVKNYIDKYDQKRGINVDLINKQLSNIPMFKQGMSPITFQQGAQQFLRSLPFEYQLEQLNKIQDKCPFLLVDPQTRQLTTLGNVKYGLADLYRFMGLSFVPAKIGKVKFSKQKYNPKIPAKFNPLYQPVDYNYSIPDFRGNQILSSIYAQSPSSYYSKLKHFYSNLSNFFNISGGVDNEYKMSGGGKLFIDSSMKDIMELLKYIYKTEADPNYIYNHMLTYGRNDRPMQTYFRNNFDALLNQMAVSHLIYKIKDHHPDKNIKVSSRALENYKAAKKYYQSHPESVEVHTARPKKASEKKSHKPHKTYKSHKKEEIKGGKRRRKRRN